MEAFQKIQMYGQEYKDSLALADDRKARMISLVAEAREEGYAMEAISKASGLSRQTLYVNQT